MSPIFLSTDFQSPPERPYHSPGAGVGITGSLNTQMPPLGQSSTRSAALEFGAGLCPPPPVLDPLFMPSAAFFPSQGCPILWSGCSNCPFILPYGCGLLEGRWQGVQNNLAVALIAPNKLCPLYRPHFPPFTLFSPFSEPEPSKPPPTIETQGQERCTHFWGTQP